MTIYLDAVAYTHLGQRIVNATAITCVGNVIKINDVKVASPFTIQAIGYQASLMGIDMPGGYIDYMRDWGVVVNIKKVNKVKIEKYTGALQSKDVYKRKKWIR